MHFPMNRTFASSYVSPILREKISSCENSPREKSFLYIIHSVSFSDLLDNVITFRKADAILEFPTFEGDKAGDIWFQFKTTASDGVMIHDTGDTDDDFIQIRMISK